MKLINKYGVIFYPGDWVLIDKTLLGVIVSEGPTLYCEILFFSTASYRVVKAHWLIDDFTKIPKNEIPLYTKDFLNILHSNKYHNFIYSSKFQSKFIDNQLLTNNDLIWITKNE